MRTPFTLLALVCLAIDTLSARGGRFDTTPWPLGENTELGVTKVVISVGAFQADGQNVAIVDRWLDFAPGTERLEEFIEREIRSIVLTPPSGWSVTKYRLDVSTDWTQGLAAELRDFPVDQVIDGKVPRRLFRFPFEYSGVGDQLPITGYEVWARKGNEIKRFSTLGAGVNTFGSSCSVLTAQSALERGRLSMGGPLYSPDWDERELTVWQGDKFVVFDRDGYPLRWSEEPPSFFTPTTGPLKLSIRRNPDGTIEVNVSGDGAYSTVIEESTDLIRWTSVSLSSVGLKRTLDSAVGNRFYRLRPQAVVQKLSN